MDKLDPCLWCGGDMVEDDYTVDFAHQIVTLKTHCDNCRTKILFRCHFENDPLSEAIVLFNKREGKSE